MTGRWEGRLGIAIQCDGLDQYTFTSAHVYHFSKKYYGISIWYRSLDQRSRPSRICAKARLMCLWCGRLRCRNDDEVKAPVPLNIYSELNTRDGYHHPLLL